MFRMENDNGEKITVRKKHFCLLLVLQQKRLYKLFYLHLKVYISTHLRQIFCILKTKIKNLTICSTLSKKKMYWARKQKFDDDTFATTSFWHKKIKLAEWEKNPKPYYYVLQLDQANDQKLFKVFWNTQSYIYFFPFCSFNLALISICLISIFFYTG